MKEVKTHLGEEERVLDIMTFLTKNLPQKIQFMNVKGGKKDKYNRRKES